MRRIVLLAALLATGTVSAEVAQVAEYFGGG